MILIENILTYQHNHRERDNSHRVGIHNDYKGEVNRCIDHGYHHIPVIAPVRLLKMITPMIFKKKKPNENLIFFLLSEDFQNYEIINLKISSHKFSSKKNFFFRLEFL